MGMASGPVKSSAPRGLKLAGRRLWDSVLADFLLDEHERGLLLQACQTLDIVADLQAAIERLGVDCAPRELAEIRQQRLVYARLVAALRLPGGLDHDESGRKRPQRRAIRGVYSIGRDAQA
jgi:hypothetical protein